MGCFFFFFFFSVLQKKNYVIFFILFLVCKKKKNMDSTYYEIAQILDNCPLIIPDSYLPRDVVVGASHFRSKDKTEEKCNMIDVEKEVEGLEDARKELEQLENIKLIVTMIDNKDEKNNLNDIEKLLSKVTDPNIASILTEKFRSTNTQINNDVIKWEEYSTVKQKVSKKFYYDGMVQQITTAYQKITSNPQIYNKSITSTSITYPSKLPKIASLQTNPHVFPSCSVSKVIVEFILILYDISLDGCFKDCGDIFDSSMRSLMILYPALTPVIISKSDLNPSLALRHATNLLYVGVHCRIIQEMLSNDFTKEISVIQNECSMAIKSCMSDVTQRVRSQLRATKEMIELSRNDRISLFRRGVYSVVEEFSNVRESFRTITPFPLYKKLISEVCSIILYWSCETVSSMKNLSSSDCSELLEVLVHFQTFEGWFMTSSDDLSAINEASIAAREACDAFLSYDELIMFLSNVINGTQKSDSHSSELTSLISAFSRIRVT